MSMKTPTSQGSFKEVKTNLSQGIMGRQENSKLGYADPNPSSSLVGQILKHDFFICSCQLQLGSILQSQN